MKQRQLGNGLSVSEIGLGCMGMDHAYGRPAPRAEMVRLLRHALEFGCNFFDTAVVYGEANEELLGKAFSSVRDQVVQQPRVHSPAGGRFPSPTQNRPH